MMDSNGRPGSWKWFADIFLREFRGSLIFGLVVVALIFVFFAILGLVSR